MRKLVLPLLVVAVAVPAASAGGKTYLGGCTTAAKATFKPHLVVVTCADAGFYVNHIKWSSWGKKKARGKGRAHVNTCTPSCASGKFKAYRVTVKASKPSKCTGRRKRQFHSFTVHFPGKKPAGFQRTSSFPRVCADK